MLRNQEDAAGTLRTSLGKFCTFPNSESGIRDGAQFTKEEHRKRGVGSTFGLKRKYKVIKLSKYIRLVLNRD